MPSGRNSTFLYGAHARANGIRQHYLRYGGKGTPLVVVPGITSPAITWGFVAERLGEAHDTYVLDVRGRGLSEGGPHLRYTLNDYAKDVAELAAALGLRDYVVVGHSMGGRIAARLGHRHRQGIARLVIVDVRATYPNWSEESLRLRAEWLHTCDDTAIAESVRGFQEEEMAVTKVEHTGHMIPFDDLEAFLASMRGFIRA